MKLSDAKDFLVWARSQGLVVREVEVSTFNAESLIEKTRITLDPPAAAPKTRPEGGRVVNADEGQV